MDRQEGVVSRRQAHDHQATDADIRRLVRRREWARVHPGVFVNHTGPLTWRQRAWAAVLFAAPAALYGESALRSLDGPGRRDHDDSGPLHVAVDQSRTIDPPDGVKVHRLADYRAKVQANASPPRLRIEEAVLDLAAKATDEFAAIAVLGDAVQSRRTTPDRLRAALRRRTRIAHRHLLESVLDDLVAGACSALEQAYLRRVERAHRLPTAGRQVTASSKGTIYRDVVYAHQQMVVELDSRLFHSAAKARDRDLDRDLDALVESELMTVRIGWGQTVERPCRTAELLGRLLERRGWSGSAASCPRCA